MLVGPDGISLAAAVEEWFNGDVAEGAEGGGIEQAESILEAVLMSGRGGSGGGGGTATSGVLSVILTGISQEIDQLEPAIRSLRKVNPASRIVLLCEPGDEVLCRKARAWGATDYLLLPVDAASLRRALVAGPESVARPQEAPSPPLPFTPSSKSEERRVPLLSPAEVMRNIVGVNAPAHGAVLPSLPLIVQTSLFADLITGRSDFPQRVVATLQSYMTWGGSLQFTPHPAPSSSFATENAVVGTTNPGQLRAAVEFPGHGSFGALSLEVASGKATAAPPPGIAVALTQAAQWLAALLAVERRQEQLRSLAITDELSGAYNRRYFEKFMAGLLERARENRFRVTLLMFDIDDFKKYNDTFGHPAGDAIIRELIKLLRACTRPHDLVARLGGDEFAVVYWDNEAPRQPNSDHPRDAIVATERFRKAVQSHEWASTCNIQGDLSISGGLATFPWDADSIESLMARADEALLRAKAAGKNAIFLHGAACTETFTDEDTTDDEAA